MQNGLKQSRRSRQRVKTESQKLFPKSGTFNYPQERTGKRGKNIDASQVNDYAARYADNWSEISKKCKDATRGRCCFPGCTKKANESHHAVYRDAQGAIAGRELPGIHVFAQCKVHHSRLNKDGAHNRRNWIKGTKKEHYLDARQTVEYYQKLRKGFEMVQKLR